MVPCGGAELKKTLYGKAHRFRVKGKMPGAAGIEIADAYGDLFKGLSYSVNSSGVPIQKDNLYIKGASLTEAPYLTTQLPKD
jgi:hypothetical protein